MRQKRREETRSLCKSSPAALENSYKVIIRILALAEDFRTPTESM